MLIMAVAQSFSDDNAIGYVLLVLWMTSCLLVYIFGLDRHYTCCVGLLFEGDCEGDVSCDGKDRPRWASASVVPTSAKN